MLLPIPFYVNVGGNRCAQASMRSVIKYFLNYDYPLEELDRLTGRKNGYWTWPTQVVTTLYNLGLNVSYFSKTEIVPLLKGEQFIREQYFQNADTILKHTDINVLIDSVKKALSYNLFVVKKLNIEDIENSIAKNNIPIVTIDWHKINGKKGYYGHAVLVTGFDKEHIFFHQSGPIEPKANYCLGKGKFDIAWSTQETDNDAIIVTGKRRS